MSTNKGSTLKRAVLKYNNVFVNDLIALKKLCNQIKFLSEIEKVHSKLKDSYKRKDLQIKCYEKNCDCSTKIRNHFKRYHLKRRHHAEPKKKFFRKKKWKFFGRK